ncbi:MAG: TrkH family potassium uptake protein, partial [Ruminococcus sp.]|nr:TrkH family potassium uptake protein [Ruminococcus sp.]
TNFTAAVSCFNNIGPGLSVVGPMGSYAGYSPFAKLVLTAAMLLGRLEIFPLLIAVIPSTWRKR